MKRWTVDEIEILKKEHGKGSSYEYIAELLSRETNSVWRKAQNMRLMTPPYKINDWTKDEENAAIRLMNEGKTNEEISRYLNRSKIAVSIRLSKLGVVSRKTVRNGFDLTGRKFGFLTVKQKHPNRIYRQRGWECMCDCGGTKIVTTQHLLSGAVKSCGCVDNRKRGEENPFFKGYKEIHATLFGGYQRGAKRREIVFGVTIEYVWNLFEQQKRKCALSGLPIEFVTKSTKETKHGTASLDRIDSSRGYVIGNVQWVHKEINLMKMNLPEEKFKELCERVYLHNSNKTPVKTAS